MLPENVPLKTEPAKTTYLRRVEKGLIVSFVLVLVLSGSVLENLGISYQGKGGAIYHKIHITTLMIMVLFALMAPKIRLAQDKYSLLYLFLVTLTMISYVVRFGTSGIAFLLDTLLAPGLFVLLLTKMTEDVQDKIFNIIKYILLFNCLMAVVEKGLSINFIPIDAYYGEIFRSTSLWGHPLNNALNVAAAMMMVYFRLGPTERYIYFISGLIAMLAYGARAALAMYLAFFGLMAGIAFLQFFFIGQNLRKRALGLSYLFIVVGVPGIIWAVLYGGIADRIIDKMEAGEDDESGAVRFRIIEGFKDFSLDELMFGAPVSRLEVVAETLNVPVIENFLVIWIVQFGLILGLGIFFSLWMLMFSFLKGFKQVFLFGPALGLFFIMAISNNSLATKTFTLTLYLSTLYLSAIKLRRDAKRRMLIDAGYTEEQVGKVSTR